MTILDTGASYAAATLDRQAKRLVIVAANTSSSATTLTFDLSRFSSVTGGPGGVVPRWNTVTTGGSDLYTPHSDTYLSGKSLSVPFAPKSIQTLQLDGVTV
jgi:galactan endo-1,6-beta-galactosidase